jgi:hypothetical protein
MGIYAEATRLIDRSLVAFERSDPLLEDGLKVLRHSDTTLGRCDRVLDQASSLLEALHGLAELERRRLELEVRRLERDSS